MTNPDGVFDGFALDGKRKLGSFANNSIQVLVSQSGEYTSPVRNQRDNTNAIGIYKGKGILGTQLGPNKNGRKW